jgi:hypothetical protein
VKEKVYAMEVWDCDDLINHNEAAATNVRNLLRQLVTVRGAQLDVSVRCSGGGRALQTSVVMYSPYTA